MFIPRHYEDPHTLHVGTMPNRAYFIPASTRTDTVGERRTDSDRFTLLNGDWMFRYYASIYDLDAEVSRRHQAGLPAFHDRGFIDSLGASDEPRPDELRAAGYSSIPVAVGLAEPWGRPASVHECELSVPARSAVCAAGQSVRRVPAYVRASP